MGAKRTVLTKEFFCEKKEHLQNVMSCIDDILENPQKDFSVICRENGLNYMKVRRTLSLLESCHVSGSLNDVVKMDDISATAFSSPYESLYMKVFDISKTNQGKIELPADYKESVDYALGHALSEKEQKVVRLRLGFDSETRLTLQACGDIFGTTREYIRQLEKRAYRKLRCVPYRGILCFGLGDFKQREEKKIQIEAQQRVINRDMWTNFQNNPKDIKSTFLSLPVAKLALSNRAGNCLLRGNIKYLFDLLCIPKDKIVALHSLGKKSCNEIMEFLDFVSSSCGTSYVEMHEYCSSLATVEHIVYHSSLSALSMYEQLVKKKAA